MKKIPVGILGATGMVGQRFIALLSNHPWFEVALVAASPQSAGKKYKDAVKGRWLLKDPIPQNIANFKVLAVEKDMDQIVKKVSFVFCALDLEKEEIKRIENAFAQRDIPVISNNSAHRFSEDVPMLMPEINGEHLKVIEQQQKSRGWKKGFIVVKPNCSIQSYVPLLTPLLKFNPQKITITTLQAVSGAGKRLKDWPQMNENIIPFIKGEEEKSEKEPLKIWGEVKDGKINFAKGPNISATCIRVPLEDGHIASVNVIFEKKCSIEQILDAWKSFDPLKGLNLPSAPHPFITVMEDEDRPQTRLDRMIKKGMGISAGRVRQHDMFNYSFIGLSHNTIRGAAGGAILTAELLVRKGYLNGKD